MSAPQEDCSRRHGGHSHDGGDPEIDQLRPASPAQSSFGDEDDGSTGCAAPSASTRAASTLHPADEQPLAERMAQQSARSSRFDTPLDGLATVELQLCLQFLDKHNRLMAARCSHRLLQTADHPFAWCGAPVAVSSANQPQLGSLIRQSLLRHAPIALTLSSDLPVAEVAAIPRLWRLIISVGIPADLISQLLVLPSLQKLQKLQVHCSLAESALQLLPTLPALHTLHLKMRGSADWRWLPAMPALTDLHLTCLIQGFPPSLADGVGQCTQLQSLRLNGPYFEAGAFVRLCSTPAMRRLRRLRLEGLKIYDGDALMISPEYGEVFGALAGLESLRLAAVHGVDTMLPHLAHAPALRTLSVLCRPCHPNDGVAHKSTLPGREVLRQLVAAAPLLEVRLEMAASLSEWRSSWVYKMAATSAADRERMGGQWRQLQRMAAEMDRVTIVKK